MVRHGRLAWPRPSELSAAARAVYDRITGGPRASGASLFRLTDPEGRLEGPFNAMLVAPDVGGALQELGAAIRYRTSLTDRAREIAILLVAAARRSDFEWYAHERVATAAGLEPGLLADIRAGRRPGGLGPVEDATVDVVTALLTERDVPEDVHAAAEPVLGPAAIMELVVLVGYYDLLALALAAWRVPLPAGVTAPFGATADTTADTAADTTAGTTVQTSADTCADTAVGDAAAGPGTRTRARR